MDKRTLRQAIELLRTADRGEPGKTFDAGFERAITMLEELEQETPDAPPPAPGCWLKRRGLGGCD